MMTHHGINNPVRGDRSYSPGWSSYIPPKKGGKGGVNCSAWQRSATRGYGDATHEAPSDIITKNDHHHRACPDTLVVGG